VYPSAETESYAASRPLVFGLSSSAHAFTRQKRFSALPKSLRLYPTENGNQAIGWACGMDSRQSGMGLPLQLKLPKLI